MDTIELHEHVLTEAVNQIAVNEGKAAQDVLADAVRQYLDAYRERRIRAEATAWYALPAAVRAQYQGAVVAMYNGAIVDQDLDRRTLYLRVKARFGREPVLLVDGGDQPLPEFQTYSALGA